MKSKVPANICEKRGGKRGEKKERKENKRLKKEKRQGEMNLEEKKRKEAVLVPR